MPSYGTLKITSFGVGESHYVVAQRHKPTPNIPIVPFGR